ncbi:hypothetical protein Clacol_009282 [Clathrus columnatus]|uniref:Uncharacterized protein n=1 Tax=Clathrus columnatus TaxID=1419009 RepID=A0AAV5ASY0_9AGAM|nr:hypothetical protein Clacol_009282 [Clathrus columnatus]
MAISFIGSMTGRSRNGIRVAFRMLGRVKINSIEFSTLSLHGVSFYGLDAKEGIEQGRISSVAHLYLSLRIPTIYNPFFATIHIDGIRHFGPLGSGRCSTLVARLRLPRRNQTWMKLYVNDLNITVRDVIPPVVVDRLRENLLRTIFLGDVIKLDDFMMVIDSSLIWSGQGVSAVGEAQGYEVNVLGRTYDFGILKGTLLRHWQTGHGRFSLYTMNFLWYKTGVDESLGWQNLKLSDFLFYATTLISSLSFGIQKPSSLFDIELEKGELKFRKFRHRDQEILKHALQYTGEWKPQWLQPGFINSVLWDTISDLIRPLDDSVKDMN